MTEHAAAVLTGIALAMGWQTGPAVASPTLVAAGERGGPAAGAAELFAISGSLSQLLVPGSSAPLDLSMTNPGSDPLRVTGLEVALTGVVPLSGLACSSSNFAVTQYSGAGDLTVAGSSTSSLSALGVPPGALPQVSMLETHLDQDGCQGATLDLAYTGTAVGGTAGRGHGGGHGHGGGNYAGAGWGNDNGHNPRNGGGLDNGTGRHGAADGNGNGDGSSTWGPLSPTGAEGAWSITLTGLGLVVAGIVVRRRKGTRR